MVHLGLIVIPRSTSATENDNRSPARLQYGETKGDVFSGYREYLAVGLIEIKVVFI
jgi:hypothetical protein